MQLEKTNQALHKAQPKKKPMSTLNVSEPLAVFQRKLKDSKKIATLVTEGKFLIAYESYSIRNALKEQGFTWDDEKKAFVLDITNLEDSVVAMIKEDITPLFSKAKSLYKFQYSPKSGISFDDFRDSAKEAGLWFHKLSRAYWGYLNEAEHAIVSKTVV
ncbi:hypothetical protein 3 [Drosophila-associated adintovirus 3]|uniref:Uncharacterized protein n=1 Tax=Drosophila-associated adintovirus 3 TaxID=2744818 RepID=A0A7D4VHU4_9VIRU|nr:hypothetical protein 3 [Drosophila-associated adintovirus 3]